MNPSTTTPSYASERTHAFRWSLWGLGWRATGRLDPVRCVRGQLRREVFERDGKRCLRCGDAAADLHVDHIWPWCFGGPTKMSNLQTLCGRCNRRKADWGADYRPYGHWLPRRRATMTAQNAPTRSYR